MVAGETMDLHAHAHLSIDDVIKVLQHEIKKPASLQQLSANERDAARRARLYEMPRPVSASGVPALDRALRRPTWGKRPVLSLSFTGTGDKNGITGIPVIPANFLFRHKIR